MQITSELVRRSARSWFSTDQRRVGPAWLQLVWTVLFAVAFATVFSLLGLLLNLGQGWPEPATLGRVWCVNFVIALCVSLTIHALFAVLIPWVGAERIRRYSHRRRAVFFTSVPILGLCTGWPLGVWLVGGSGVQWVSLTPQAVVASAALALMISGVIFLFFNTAARRMEAEKRATEAQLRLLQAQIEPHFLFNTLANVLSLIDHDAPRAKQMLQAFTDYLRSSLGALRDDEATLAQELELAESYLQLLATRMEDRLHYRIEADAAARAQRLPPLLLQPLIENAVQHGLEPTIEGGTVSVSARVQGRCLVVEVQDDGRGLQAPARRAGRPGSGLALANIRQRLLARYGNDATLDLQACEPGTLARLSLPLDLPAP